MNIKTKKIIAREFLIFLICIAIGIVTFLTIYPYNYFKRNQIDGLTKDISEKRKLSDSLSKSFRLKTEKQFWFTDKYTSKFDLPKDKDYNNAKLWDRLYEIAKSDSVKYKWEKTWDKELIAFNKELGFDTPKSFQDFILTNIIYTKDIEQNKSATAINSEVDIIQNKISETSKKIVSTENQIRTAGLSFIIAVIILLFLRYIFYGIKWSIRTLKQS
jgi:hypothetical protein